MSESSYSPLRTLEEEQEDDLELGPVRKVRYKKLGGKNRYHDLFTQYDLESPPRDTRTITGVGPFGKEGSKKGICVAVTMAIALVLIVTLAVVYVSSDPTSRSELMASYFKHSSPLGTKPGVSLDDILTGKFYPKSFNGSWISDTEIQYFNDRGDLLIYNAASKITSFLVNASDILGHLEGKSPIKCTISPDRNYVLFAYDAQKVFRHSTFAKYGVLDLRSRQFQSLVPISPKIQLKQHKLLQLAEWAPTNNALIFVYMNNIFYKGSAFDTETLQLTDDGSHVVYNGITDWVYEEEVFGTDSAIWFSPDGSQLTYLTFNDTLVDEIHFEVYGEPGAAGYQYPVTESVSYPKAGRTNPTAEVTMVALPGFKSQLQLPISKTLQFADFPHERYIYGIVWTSATEVLVITLNRHQNVSRHHICTINGNCDTILIDDQQKGWIDVEIPKVSGDGNTFLTLTSQKQGDKWYRHILKYSKESRNKPLTSGQFAVDSILKWDEANHRVYFLAPHYHAAVNKVHPSSKHLYYVDDSGSNPANITCITCHSVNTRNETCEANSVEISKDASYCVQSCAGPGIPEVFIRNLQFVTSERTVWMDNAELHQKADEVSWPVIRNFEIPIDNKLTILARLQLPPNMDPSKKYPLLVDVYAGPGTQKIYDNFHVDWSDSLITSKEVIYAYIDGRGSGRQSDDLKFEVYRRLGTVEVADQIFATKWLIAHVPFIDANRTAIWGWSYGGFVTAMAMARDVTGVFKCGISVAPVTNWQFYDTIYTERYMGLPTVSDNIAAYNESDITNHIENFRHKKFLLVHGTADDNVHYQQSMVLSRALEKADILFRQMSYPDENHSLGSVRRHLYHSLEDFLFNECL